MGAIERMFDFDFLLIWLIDWFFILFLRIVLGYECSMILEESSISTTTSSSSSNQFNGVIIPTLGYYFDISYISHVIFSFVPQIFKWYFSFFHLPQNFHHFYEIWLDWFLIWFDRMESTHFKEINNITFYKFFGEISSRNSWKFENEWDFRSSSWSSWHSSFGF